MARQTARERSGKIAPVDVDVSVPVDLLIGGEWLHADVDPEDLSLRERGRVRVAVKDLIGSPSTDDWAVFSAWTILLRDHPSLTAEMVADLTPRQVRIGVPVVVEGKAPVDGS